MNQDEIKDKIRDYIHRVLGDLMASQIDDDASIIESRILDSVNTLQLVSHLEDTFGIEISAHEILSDNLDSIQKMSDFILSKLK